MRKMLSRWLLLAQKLLGLRLKLQDTLLLELAVVSVRPRREARRRVAQRRLAVKSTESSSIRP